MDFLVNLIYKNKANLYNIDNFIDRRDDAAQ